MTDYIPVVMSFDRNYSDYAAVTTQSALYHTKNKLKFYWLIPRKDLLLINELKKKITHKNLIEIKIIEVDDHDIFNEIEISSHWGNVAFNKLLIPKLVLEKKVIYLDTDLLVLDDLESFYIINIKDYLIAGVHDPDGIKTDIINNKNNFDYINSGAMLMNLDLFRSNNYFEKISKIIQINKNNILSDQCVFNKYTESKKLIVDKKYNFLIYPNLIEEHEKKIIENLQENKIKIIHFVGPVKPWMEWCNLLVTNIYNFYSNKLREVEVKIKKISNILQALEYISILDKNCSFNKSNIIKYKIIKKLENTIQKSHIDNDLILKNLFNLMAVNKNILELNKIKTDIIKILVQYKLRENKNLSFPQVMESINFNI